MVNKIAKIMESLVYERKMPNDERYKDAMISNEYPGYKITYYPRNFDGDSPEFWLRYYDKIYSGKTVIVIDCDRFNDIKDMAILMVSAINLCKH